MDEIATLFVCQRCGYCCHGETTVSLDKTDQQRMVEHLGLTRQEVADRFWRISGNVVQMKVVDGHCIFYRDGCTVYQGRPWRCAQWPLIPALLQDRANFSAIGDSCPGISKDISYEAFSCFLKRLLAPDKDEGQEER